MKIKNKKKYDTCIQLNNDEYGRAIISFAKMLADLLEEHIGNGDPVKAIEEYTEECIRKADDVYSMSGHSLVCAVQFLCNTWVYGDELRKWHNKQYGYHGEGIVNPTMIHVE